MCIQYTHSSTTNRVLRNHQWMHAFASIFMVSRYTSNNTRFLHILLLHNLRAFLYHLIHVLRKIRKKNQIKKNTSLPSKSIYFSIRRFCFVYFFFSFNCTRVLCRYFVVVKWELAYSDTRALTWSKTIDLRVVFLFRKLQVMRL